MESERRADRRTARVCAQIVNMAGRFSSKLFSEDDFIPGAAEKRQTTEEMQAVLMNWKAGIAKSKSQRGKVQKVANGRR
jgi:hypothetical protein